MKGWIVLEDLLLLLGLLGVVGSIGMRWVLRQQPAATPDEPLAGSGQWRDEAGRAGPSCGRPKRRRRR